MGYRYYIEARLSGQCIIAQETKECKTFIGFFDIYDKIQDQISYS